MKISTEQPILNRNQFLRTCGASCLGLSALTFLESCGGAYYAQKPTIRDKAIVVAKTEFQEVTKKGTKIRPFVLVKLENQNFPIYLYRVSDAEYTAVLMKCSHQGNELNAHDGYLTCPAHGSEYDKTGKVTEGPAEKNLTAYKVTSDAENVYIQIA